MPSVRPFVTAGVALVGASVIAVSPVAPPQPQARTVGMEVSLSASTTSDFCEVVESALCNAGSPAPSDNPFAGVNAAAAPNMFNIPANLFIALANVPYNFFNALGRGDVPLGSLPDNGFSFVNDRTGISLNQTGVVGLTADLEYGGSWWVYHPFNVLGTDSADIARYQGLVNTLIPFPALSVGLGNILATIAASQLPMNVGCTGTNFGACDHPEQILSTMFDFRHIVDLFSPGGYTFPAVDNPITCSSDGLCDIKDPNGEPEPWSNGNYALNIFDPFENFYNSLTETPDFTKIKVPTLSMIVNTITNLIRGLNTAFNPFVLGTQCGLCALVVPTPPGVTKPGSTNPGTLIPGVPASESASTQLVAARSGEGSSANIADDADASGDAVGQVGSAGTGGVSGDASTPAAEQLETTVSDSSEDVAVEEDSSTDDATIDESDVDVVDENVDENIDENVDETTVSDETTVADDDTDTGAQGDTGGDTGGDTSKDSSGAGNDD